MMLQKPIQLSISEFISLRTKYFHNKFIVFNDRILLILFGNKKKTQESLMKLYFRKVKLN